MDIWESASLTEKGVDLHNRLINGKTLKITKVKTGAGKVPVMYLRQQTEVTNPIQELTLQPATISDDNIIIPVLLENIGLTESYELWQVGFYAEDPEEGEILFCIAQASQSKNIPSEAESPGFSITWDFYFNTSNTVPFEVKLESAGVVNIESYEVHTKAICDVNDRVDHLNADLGTFSGNLDSFNPYFKGIESMNIKKIAGETNPDEVIEKTGAWTKVGSSETEGYFNVAMGWINMQFWVNSWKVQMRIKYGKNNWSPWKTIYTSV